MKLQDLNMTDCKISENNDSWKMQDLENDGSNRRAGKCGSVIFNVSLFAGPAFYDFQQCCRLVVTKIS